MLLPLAFFFGGAPSSPELMLVFVAILLLFGAKRLPEIARQLGKSLEQFKRAAKDVSDEIMKADTEPSKTRTPRLPSQSFPSDASKRPGSSSGEEACLEDVGGDEPAEKPAEGNSRSETSPDEERADAGTS